MSDKLAGRVRDEERLPSCHRSTCDLRRAYFAEAGEIAIRYGVVFDRIQEHVYAAGLRERHLSMLPIRHIDDLAQAVACVEGVELAWSDLIEHHERALVRACREQSQTTDSIVFVRRFYAELRRRSRCDHDRRPPSLRSFVGARSLRRWLRDRMLQSLERAADAARTRPRLRLIAEPRVRWAAGGRTAPLIKAIAEGPRPAPAYAVTLQGASLRSWSRSTSVSG